MISNVWSKKERDKKECELWMMMIIKELIKKAQTNYMRFEDDGEKEKRKLE